MTRVLYTAPGSAWSTGGAQFAIERESTSTPLIVAARCRLGSKKNVEWALLDTGAQWSVIGGEVASSLEGEYCEIGPALTMTTRWGRFTGELRQLEITLEADEGDSLQVLATVLVLPEWPGPVVLGYRGFLERIRLGLDPGSSSDDQWMFFGSVG